MKRKWFFIIPFFLVITIFMGLTIWVEWFPVSDFTHPGEWVVDR